MARKNLLTSLMSQPGATGDRPQPRTQERPSSTQKPPLKGAVGAVSQTIADLKSRAVTDIDPALIDAGGLADRVEHDAHDQAQLTASIRKYGQQVPVLVRPHPETEGRYQVVYGRRRVLAARELGLPVRAMIRVLSDEALILAQGQENSARRDLTFIEKANFARQMEEAGLTRQVIMDGLSVDKTEASRLLSVAAQVPAAVIAAIGAAPSIGRTRWQALADRLRSLDMKEAEIIALATGETSDARFEALLKALDARKGKRGVSDSPSGKTVVPVHDAAGRKIGTLTQGPRGPVLALATDEARFADWLADNLSRLHDDWKAGKS